MKDYLKQNGIGSKVMYTEKLNELEYVKQLIGYQPMPVNDLVNSKILSLPISGTMDENSINEVCKTISKFYQGE